MQEVPGAGLGAGSWDEAELSTESVGVMPQESAFSVTSTFVSESSRWAGLTQTVALGPLGRVAG